MFELFRLSLSKEIRVLIIVCLWFAFLAKGVSGTGSICNVFSFSGQVQVQCSSTNLSDIQDHSIFSGGTTPYTPSDATSLQLNGLQNAVVESGTFKDYTQLESLYLRSAANNINFTFERGAFAGLQSLTTLELSPLAIPVLSASAFENFTAVRSTLRLTVQSTVPMFLNPNLEDLLTGLTFLTFIGSVHCDCHILWLKSVLNMYAYQDDDVTCSSSHPSLSGVDILAANDSVLSSICPDICTTDLNNCHSDADCTAPSTNQFTCTCREGFVGDGFTCSDVDECLLNVTCSADSTCINTAGGFICLCDRNQTYNGSQCICSDNMVQRTGVGCVCPEGLMLNASSGLCECVSNHMTYSSSSQFCECTGNRTLTNETVCLCKYGFFEDGITGECICNPGQEYSVALDRCTCVGRHTVYNETLSHCVCDRNSTLSGTLCACRDMFREDAGTESCICGDGLEYNADEGACHCPGDNMEYNSTSATCLCARNRTLNGSACECSEGFREDAGSCVCLDGLSFSATEGLCACVGQPYMVYNSSSSQCECFGNRTFNGSDCVCDGRFEEDVTSGACICRSGLAFSHTSALCQCVGNNMHYNSTVRECDCDVNRTFNGSGECVCRDLFYESNGVCTCAPGLEYSAGSEECVCPYGDLVYIGESEMCECVGNRTFNGSNCICSDTFTEDAFGGDCVCLPGLTYLPESKKCECANSRMVYNESENRCFCKGNFSSTDENECFCEGNLLVGDNEMGCVCAFEMSFNSSLKLCLSECVYPQASSPTTGLCFCSPGREGCPTVLQSLLSSLADDENVTFEAVLTAVVGAQAQLDSGMALQSNATDNLVALLTAASSQLSRLFSTSTVADFDSALDSAEAILNLTSVLLKDGNSAVLRDSESVSRHVGDLLTVVHVVGVALVGVARHAPSGVVEVTSGSVFLRVVSLEAASNSSEWTTLSTTSSVPGGEEGVSFLILPQNLANLTNSSSNCSLSVISGVVRGLNRVLPTYDNFSASPPERILSGLCESRDPPPQPTSSLNSLVLISSLYSECSGVNTSLLDPPVRITLHHQGSNFVSPHCVADSNQVFGRDVGWSEEGCEVVSSTASRTECSCSHLTSFAILMHPSAPKSSAVLQIATKVGLSVSIVCLLVTVVILFAVKVKSELIKVHRQLALSLLLTEVVFLVGVDREAVPSPDGLCVTFAAVLHYLLLVTFTWMLIEGVHILVYLIVVFFSSKVYILYYFLGWCIPLPIVAVSLTAGFCDYGSRSHCWISGDATIWAFRAPIIFVLAVNLVILVVTVVIVARQKRKRQKDLSAVIDALRTAIVLFPVLGGCWAVGLFIFGDNAVYIEIIEWIFFALVILQGILIFVFNCFLKKEVRVAVLKKVGYEKHMLNRNLGSVESRTSTLQGTLFHTLKKKISTSSFSVAQSRKESASSVNSTSPLHLKFSDLKDNSLDGSLDAITESTENL